MVDNLTSSFKQEYPLFEIIFSVADANDPAIQVVKKLIARYTDVDAKLIIGTNEGSSIQSALAHLLTSVR